MMRSAIARLGRVVTGLVIGAAMLLMAGPLSPVAAQPGQGGGAQVYQNWSPVGTPATRSVSSVTANVAIPTGGLTARVCNIGTVDAYVVLGTANTVVATTASGSLLQGGKCQPFNRQPFSTRYTYLAAITAASTTNLRVEVGLGSPGASESGTDTVSGTVTANQGTAGSSAWPVKIDQTTPGTTNGVQVNAALPAGSAIVGKVGIDQTTPGTTNAVVDQGVINAIVAGYITPPFGVTPSPSASSSVGIAPAVDGSAVSSKVLKAGAGNLYNVYVTAGSTPLWLMVFNAVAAPSNGATTAGIASGNLQDCIPVPANTAQAINYGGGPPEPFSVGITVAASSTACGTLTLSATAFIHGSAK